MFYIHKYYLLNHFVYHPFYPNTTKMPNICVFFCSAYNRMLKSATQQVMIAVRQPGTKKLFLKERNGFLFINEEFYGKFITFQSEASNSSFAFCRYMRNFSELFSCMHIADMNFDNGCFYSSDRIAESHRCMCVTSRVEHDTIIVKAHSLNFINKFAFNITLIIMKLN